MREAAFMFPGYSRVVLRMMGARDVANLLEGEDVKALESLTREVLTGHD